MRIQTVKSLAVSFLMLVGLAYYIHYFLVQKRIMDEQHAILIQELEQMKVDAKQIKADLPPTKIKEISNETREQTLKYIEECTNNRKCVFKLFGEATKNPKVSLTILDDVWYQFDQDNVEVLRQILRDKVQDAAINPTSYVTMPSDAPFYPIAVKNTKNTRSYIVFISHGLTPQGQLLLDETILEGS